LPFWKDDYWLTSTGLQYPADWYCNTRATSKFTRSLRPISCPKPCMFAYAIEQRMKSERGRQKGAEKQDRHCTYSYILTLRPCSYCCSGKAISITHSESVSVALGTQHAMHMRNHVICCLPRSKIFFHITS